MKHKIGGHVLGAQRNGWGDIAPHLVCVVAVDESGAFDELDPRCIKIWRTQSNSNHVDAPGDFDRLPDSQLFAAGEYWFDELYPTVKPVLDRHTNIWWQPTNEINSPRIVEYLRGFMAAADKVGVKLALFGDAGDSPLWDDWLSTWVPLLRDAAANGHIYSRHAYAGVNSDSDYLTDLNGAPSDNNSLRPLIEADYLYSQGINIPIVISELGWYGGYHQPGDDWPVDLAIYNEMLLKRPLIVGGALWTWGEWDTAPASNLSGIFTEELAAQFSWYDGSQWFEFDYTEPEPEPEKHKAIVLKAPQEIEPDKWLAIADYGFDYRHTLTASHDDTLTILKGGNSESYAKIVYPELPSQQETIALVESAGYAWTDVTGEIFTIETPWHDGLVFAPVFDEPHVITSRFNDPRDYGRHEGTDLDIIGEPADSKKPVRCVYPGRVVYSGYKPNAYGHRVITESVYNGVRFFLWYCHMDSTFPAVGLYVATGQPLGELGGTGPGKGAFAEHVHLNMQVPGMGLSGYVIDDVIDPEPFITVKGPTIPDPEPQVIDLIDYVMPAGERQYMIQNVGAGQERYRPQQYQDGHLIQKGRQGEYYTADDQYIYLVWDTTPNDDEYYVRTAAAGSDEPAPYLARFMTVGEWWTHHTPHYVAFYNKSDCQNSGSVHEGTAGQGAKIVAHYDEFTTPYGATFSDVLQINTVHEHQYYAKNFGRMGWKSAWGEAWATPENVNNQTPEPLNIPACLKGH